MILSTFPRNNVTFSDGLPIFYFASWKPWSPRMKRSDSADSPGQPPRALSVSSVRVCLHNRDILVYFCEWEELIWWRVALSSSHFREKQQLCRETSRVAIGWRSVVPLASRIFSVIIILGARALCVDKTVIYVWLKRIVIVFS